MSSSLNPKELTASFPSNKLCQQEEEDGESQLGMTGLAESRAAGVGPGSTRAKVDALRNRCGNWLRLLKSLGLRSQCCYHLQGVSLYRVAKSAEMGER